MDNAYFPMGSPQKNASTQFSIDFTRPKYWFSLTYSILLKTIDMSKGVLSSWWL
jgi:hypothetical protein